MDINMCKKKNVLLLGDSIRRGYQPIVTELLKDRANVVATDENGQFALYTLSSLKRWLSVFKENDIIHWNNGIHDAGHNPKRSPIQIPLEDYVKNLQHIIDALKDTGVKILWATTTPVHPKRTFDTREWAWRNSEIDEYNKAALGVMQKNDIDVNDLHKLISSDPDRYFMDDMLHLNEEGKKAAGEQVAEFISRYI